MGAYMLGHGRPVAQTTLLQAGLWKHFIWKYYTTRCTCICGVSAGLMHTRPLSCCVEAPHVEVLYYQVYTLRQAGSAIPPGMYAYKYIRIFVGSRQACCTNYPPSSCCVEEVYMEVLYY